MKCDFSIRHYREILLKFKDNYEFVIPTDSLLLDTDAKNKILLRHDVDYSLENAYYLSLTEKELDITAIYFFRFHGPYNLYSHKSKTLIQRIKSNGHEVGYHYEFFKSENLEQAYDRINKETIIFQELLGQEIVHGCPHQTARNINLVDEFDFNKILLNNFYYKSLAGTFKYLSDANSFWREGCVCNHHHSNLNLYINIHPQFWFSGDNEYKSEILGMENHNYLEIKLLNNLLSKGNIDSYIGKDYSVLNEKNTENVEDLWENIKKDKSRNHRKHVSKIPEINTLNNMIELEKIWETFESDKSSEISEFNNDYIFESNKPEHQLNEVCITIDIDWAPDELIIKVIKSLDKKGLKATFFATHKCDIDFGEHEVAIHPNFFKNNKSEKICSDLKSEYPNSVGLRAHSLFTHNRLYSIYNNNDILYTSNYEMFMQEKIKPISMRSGIIEFPIFFMDDFILKHKKSLIKKYKEDIFSVSNINFDLNGLKIFDFHPIHLFINSYSSEHYEECKEFYHNPHELSKKIWDGKGCRTLFIDLLEKIVEEGIQPVTMHELWKKANAK